jgi:peptidoglycan/LPS O-acetylase OafA/YrhL
MTHKILSGFKIHDNLMLFICMATCIGFAWLLHTIVEKPLIQLGRRITKKEAVSKDLMVSEPAN